MSVFRRSVLAVLLAATVVAGIAPVLQAQGNQNTQIQIAINQLVTGVTTFVRARFNPNGYILWGSGTDAAGYGIRDSDGTIQWKNAGGDWANIGSGGGGGGAPSDASYWVRTASSGLSNESALGALGTGLVKNTTTTGVPSIAVAADIISLWTGTCNGTTVLAGNGTCIGTSGGAPSTSTYLTQVPDAGLSAEQALSLLTTGLMKVTTTTGVVSTAVVGDVIGLWTGTCNGTTVLAGDGTCVLATGAPTNATYLTQTPNGSLSAEQALSLLTTGLMKVTTGTGIVSVAAVADITGLFSGTCNGTTVLSGAGTCVANSGAPTTATYWVRTADGTLTNESVMGALATGLVKNTTTTGVPSIAVVGDILGLFTGTCNGTTVLAGNGTCITVSGGGGAPTTATYLTQVPDAGLSAEQALSVLATGLLKVTTTTGVVSAANVTDILGYFSGTCNGSTVLAGNGTCVTPAGGGGAPTDATYLTQTPNATLTNEQALSLLATGLLKVTTTTGVVSAAAASDVVALFSGTCNATTVLVGNGTCAALSTNFNIITSGTNTIAAMLVGTGASLAPTGSGTVTANVLASGITVPSPLVTGLLDLVATGVRFTAADGVLTLLGLGNGNDENLTVDLDNAAANTIALASGTGANVITWTGTLRAATLSVSTGTVLVTSTAAFTNGAAAALGTLTNAPAAGDPTKWIPINDNGTTRYIPAW